MNFFQKKGKKMKNIIIIDMENINSIEIRTEDSGNNSIILQLRNRKKESSIEIFFREEYKEKISIKEDGTCEIPEKYYPDGSVLHIRYTDAEKDYAFIHFIGNKLLISDITVIQKTDSIFELVGTLKPQIVINYLEKLSKIVSELTKASIKSCYIDLEKARNNLINSLRVKGIEIPDSATINDISEKIKEIKSGISLFSTINKPTHLNLTTSLSFKIQKCTKKGE